MIAQFTIYNVKHISSNNSEDIALKIQFFCFYGVAKCERKCVSWLWKFGSRKVMEKFLTGADTNFD